MYGVQVGDSSPEALAKRGIAVMERICELKRERRATSNLQGLEEDSEQEACSIQEENEEAHLEAAADMVDQNADNTATAPMNTHSPVMEEDIDMGVDDHSNDDEVDDRDDTRSISSDLSGYADWTLYHGATPGDDAYSWSEESSYDPRLLGLKDIRWLDRCRTLGYNAQATGITKTFVSGLGRYDDYGSFVIKRSGSDPNDLGADEYDCYTAGGGDVEDPTFPFHEACYRVLSACLGYKDASEINKDVLYDIMRRNSQVYGRALDLDYGGVQLEQFFSPQRGEEVCPQWFQIQNFSLTRLVPHVYSRYGYKGIICSSKDSAHITTTDINTTRPVTQSPARSTPCSTI